MIFRNLHRLVTVPPWRDQQRLRVAAFFDGRPGHEKQTKGILQSLGEMVEIEVVEIVVPNLGIWHRLRQLARLLTPFLIESDPRLAGVDLLLGTGSRTHLPILLGKKAHQCPAVVCMSPALPLRHCFDLCFVPEHDGVRQSSNVLHTVGAPNCCRNLHRHRDDRGLIAIGGIDDKSHRWNSVALLDMVRQIIEKETKIRWTLTSSPRTPEETVEGLALMAEKNENAEFRPFRETPPGWIETQYGACQTAWVSGDSISMLYEALSAGCRVGLLPVEWRCRHGKFMRNEELLVKKNLILPFARWQRGENWGDAVTYFNEAQRCAERILRIWKQKN